MIVALRGHEQQPSFPELQSTSLALPASSHVLLAPFHVPISQPIEPTSVHHGVYLLWLLPTLTQRGTLDRIASTLLWTIAIVKSYAIG